MKHNSSALLDDGAPLYAQICDALRQRILSGQYAARSRLPSESALEATYGVSRVTVRQALKSLEKARLIYRVHGKGTFVGQPKVMQNAAEIRGFSAVMADQGRHTRNQVLLFKERPADADVAEHLNLEVGSSVTEIKRLRLVDGVPMSLDHTFLPAAIGRRLSGFDLETRDLFDIFESDFGLLLTKAALEIEAMQGPRALCKALDVPGGTPILKVQRTTSVAGGAPIDFELLYYRADRFRYHVNVDRFAGASSSLHRLNGTPALQKFTAADTGL